MAVISETRKQWDVDGEADVTVSVRIDDDNYTHGDYVVIRDVKNGEALVHRTHIDSLIECLEAAVETF